MTDLAALIAELEKATDGSRKLDGKIAMSQGWTCESLKAHGERRAWWRKPGAEWFSRSEFPPDYTTSLDAAMTLVPEGMSAEVSFPIVGFPAGEDPAKASVNDWDEDFTVSGNTWTAFADAPALAICIASLRAILHERGNR